MSYALGLKKKPWEEWLRHLQRQWMMMMMMMISNTRQSNRCGGGTTQRRWTTITTTTGRAGIRAYWDVLSLCQVMIGMTQQIYGMG
jgi:hypothetical protein